MIESNLVAANASEMLNSIQGQDLERRLSLYQVFLRIYDRNPSLLNEILNLENLSSPTCPGTAPRYVQGIVCNEQAYLITNLSEGKSQTLQQPQQIWLFGRDRRSAIQVNDQRLSRRHAAIQYVKHQGFYLIDLNSSNGSFVNSEPVKHRQLLKDGDRIRLSSISFSFFIHKEVRIIEPIPLEVLNSLTAEVSCTDMSLLDETIPPSAERNPTPKKPDEDTSVFPNIETLSQEEDDDSEEFFLPTVMQLKPSQKAEILDRFLKKQHYDS